MITGIVAEYNPFHSGHQYQTEKLKENGADGIIAVMSGNFVQRCEPAFFRKHARAEAAVRGGIDLVIELPVRFATASAEKFAFGAVYLLERVSDGEFEIWESGISDEELSASLSTLDPIRCVCSIVSNDGNIVIKSYK